MKTLFLTSAAALVLLGILRLTTAQPAPTIHVRWRADVSEQARVSYEAELRMTNPTFLEGTTYAYELLDTQPDMIRTLVQHPGVEDTHEIDRTAFTVRPTAPPGDAIRWIADDWPVLRSPSVRQALIWMLVVAAVFSGLRMIGGGRRRAAARGKTV